MFTIIVASILGIVAGVFDAIVVGGVLTLFAGTIFSFIFPLNIFWPLLLPLFA